MPRIIDAEIVLPHLEIGYREQQADWAETDPNKVSFIKNKPVIPDVQINSDWSENDTTKKSHILNRTHYREFSISSYSENINLYASGGKSTGSVYGYNQYPAGFMQKFKEGNRFLFTLGNNAFSGDIHQRRYLRAFYVGNIHLHIPDLPDTGEDWCVYSDLLGQDSLHFIVDNSYTESYSLEMNIYEATYHQLNENYIPDTIARVSQIELLDGNATIASETNSIVTIKGGVKQEDGLISNSSANDITLAKVAKTGDYSDLANTPDIASIADGEIAIHDADSNAHNGVDGRVSTIENVIPSEVYDEGNELADRFFVNSTVSTETATFRGNYNVVNDLGLSASSTHVQIATALDSTIVTADKNDYCNVEIPSTSFSEFEGYESFTTVDDYVEKYVIYNDAYTYVTDLNKSSLNITPGTTIAYLNNLLRVDRYKYVEVEGGTDYWDFDYTYNNSGFTADQWSTINSKATKTKIDQIAINTGNISTNATNIAQLDSDLNKNYPYIGVSTNWGTIANNCYLRSTYFKDSVVPQKKGDLVFSQGTRNFHRCGDLVWDAGQGCYKTNPTFLFHLGEDNINPDWSQADTTKKDYIKNKPTTISGYGITDAKIESGTITLGSNTITPLTSHQDISGKADKVSNATNGNFAGLDTNGNLTDSGKKASDFVKVANIDISGQTTTILQLTKNLFTSGSNHIDYARWYTINDGTAANITDKPVSGKGFICEAKLYRSATSTDYAYFLTCIVKDNELNPFVAIVNNNTTTIVWTRLDTKNTAGSTDTSSKIYLVGATSQAANPQTYSDNEVYAQNGMLEAKEVQVNEAAKLVWDSTNQCMRITFN